MVVRQIFSAKIMNNFLQEKQKKNVAQQIFLRKSKNICHMANFLQKLKNFVA